MKLPLDQSSHARPFLLFLLVPLPTFAIDTGWQVWKGLRDSGPTLLQLLACRMIDYTQSQHPQGLIGRILQLSGNAVGHAQPEIN